MIKDEYGIQREYILLHEVLKRLRIAGLETTKSGSETDGSILIYEFNINYAFLEFGTLCAILNDAEIVKGEKIEILYLQNLQIRDKDIPIKNYSFSEISKAVDTLAAVNEVIKDITGEAAKGTYKKRINLTKDGLYSFNTNKYLKLFKEDKDKEIVQQSTLNTNCWMKIFTGVVALSAFITLIIQLPTCKSNTQFPPMAQEQDTSRIHKKCNVVKDSPLQEYHKVQKDTLKFDSSKIK